MARFSASKIAALLNARHLAKYAIELAVVGAVFFALTKLDLALAALPAGIVPISVAPGFALAAVVLRGLRISVALFAAGAVAHAPVPLPDLTAADAAVAFAMAAGSALAAMLGGYLLRMSSHGRSPLQTPADAVKFALITLGPTAGAGALLNVLVLCLLGRADFADFAGLGWTWWLRDAAGILVVAPAVILWSIEDVRGSNRPAAWLRASWAAATAFAAGVLGFVAFSSFLDLHVDRSVLAIIALSPLVWAALRCSPRVAAGCTLILSVFAVWGTWSGTGFSALGPEEAFVSCAVFAISAALLGLLLSTDAAERERAKSRLAQKEQNLRALLSHAEIGLAQADTTGRIKLVNTQFCNIVRRPAAELLQSKIEDVVKSDDGRRLEELLGAAIDRGESFATESKTVLPDGTHAWIKSSVAAILSDTGAARGIVTVADDVTARRDAEDKLLQEHDKLLATLRQRTSELNDARQAIQDEIARRRKVEEALRHDITERRKTHDALMESEWRFRTVIQGITDYAIFMLDRDGCITNWNMGAQRIHQYTTTEIVGGHFSRFYSEDEQQSGEPARALQVAAYEGKHVAEGWRVRRDDGKFWASVVIEAIRDEAGTLVGFVNITRDITERREAQASLERAQEQLAQSQKMEALGQLTGSIAHDFNNLLMIVSGHAQLLRRRLSDPKQLQAIEAVHSAANRGESLTRQLLAFSRRQPINPIVVDLKERIEAVHEMLLGSLRGNVALRCEIAPNVWPVEVDVAEFELALVNTVVNARDAMPGGGTITLSARNVSLQKIDGDGQLEGDFVALSIADTGVGIAPDVLPRIFEPFYTTKALGKGTGLGLAQVYGFSHQSGGAVTADSTVGQGTAITIYLPRKHAAVMKAVEAPPSQPGLLGQGRILVVEDNPEVAEVTASLVEQLGFQVLRSSNATDALNRLQRGDQVTLVFSDIVMPGSMNGIALAQEINDRYPNIPVLLTSGYSDVVQTAGSQHRVLRKPFQLHALEKAIAEALENARARVADERVLKFPGRKHGQVGAAGR